MGLETAKFRQENIMIAYLEVMKSHGEYATRIKKIEVYIDVSIKTGYSVNYVGNVVRRILKEKGENHLSALLLRHS